MKTVHDFKMTRTEFSSYLLNFKKSLIINSKRNVEVGEFVRMFEYDECLNVLSGRNLMFEVLYVDKTPGLIGIGNVWSIGLEKVRKFESS